MNIFSLSGADLARCFGVDRAQITRWKKAGMPHAKEKYNLPACIRWRVEYSQLRTEPSKEKSAVEADKDRWLASVRREQAKKARLERLKLEGRLVDSDEALLVLSEELTAAKNALRGIGRKLAPRVSNTEPSEAESEINSEVEQILTKLATRLEKKAKRENKRR